LNLTLAQLRTQVNDGLLPVYLVAGDEPLLINEALDLLRIAARKDGYEDREVYVAGGKFDWDQLRSGLDTISLFASRRIVEVRLPTGKPGRTGGAMLAELAENPAPDTLLVIIAEEFDNSIAKTKWVKTVSAAGALVQIKPVTIAQLPVWLERTIKQAGLKFDDDAIEVLTHHVEGNLLAARQEIDKLALIAPDGHVDADMVRQSVADGARFDVFQLSDAVVGADQQRAIRILNGLKSEGIAAPLVLWALVREVMTLSAVWSGMQGGKPAGRAMQDAGVWRNRQDGVGRCLRRHNEESMQYLLQAAAMADRVVKGGKQGSPWGALLELVQAIGQPQTAVRGQLSV